MNRLDQLVADFVSPHVVAGLGENAAEVQVNMSGGKDSTAAYLLHVERGVRFRAVMADTGHEHPLTYEFVEALPRLAGGPRIEMVRADFAADFARKRAFIEKHWPRRGVSPERVARALELMHPTGHPFLDLCMLKGRFPGAKSRFCTEETKITPLFLGVQLPALRAGLAVLSVQAVRRQESLARSGLEPWQRLSAPYGFKPARHGLTPDQVAAFEIYASRPLLDWTIGDVFAMHARHGIAPNRLYGLGMGRVGCMPCIMARKDELRAIAHQFPDVIEMLSEWEQIVSGVSRRGNATFFAAKDDPLFRERGEITTDTHGIRNHVEWAKTIRGGRQYSFDMSQLAIDFNTSCNAQGLCE